MACETEVGIEFNKLGGVVIVEAYVFGLIIPEFALVYIL